MSELYRPAHEWATKIRNKEISSQELCSMYLDQSEKINSHCNAYSWLERDDVLKSAAIWDNHISNDSDSLPPFAGIPMPVKDLAECRDQPLRLGSQATENWLGKTDSASIASLRQAGFVFMGRSTAPEFGTLPVTESAAFGATRNPWNLERTPGGSSGGAAAIVAAGAAPIAHASDGGGSIRIPASCCGLVGLKASRARVPKGPIVSEVMHGFSTDGCVSRDIRDTAIFLDQIARIDPTGWVHAPPHATSYEQSLKETAPRLRIAVDFFGPMGDQVDPAVERAMEQLAKELERKGHILVDTRPDWSVMERTELWSDFMAVWRTLPAYVPLQNLERVEKHNRELLASGQEQNCIAYLQSVLRLQAFTRAVTAQFYRDFDLLLSPVTVCSPPEIGWLFEDRSLDAEQVMMKCAEAVPGTAWVNVTGQPAISLPVGKFDDGLPLGIQLIGPPLREDLLLQVGLEMESVYQWQNERPNMEFAH